MTRYDVAIEPAPEEKPILTIGAVTIGGHPVALLFGLEDRAKVVRWLAPDLHDEVAALRARVAELEAAITHNDPCRPCGCSKRFECHAWGCPTLPADDVPVLPQPRQAEDPHDSELHHDYVLGRDLPAIPHQRDEEAL